MDIFRRYTWPGNIRELENIVLRCLMVAEDEIVMPGDLPEHMLHRANAPSSLINLDGEDVAPLEAYDREIFKRALEQHGTFNRAAQALGVTHRTVSLKAKKYGLKRKTDKK
jgi:transcriptional regulator with PAS, ATPase and Fis domain